MEGGENVGGLHSVGRMSDNESEDPPTPDKFGAFLRFGDDIAPVFDALTIEQVRRV